MSNSKIWNYWAKHYEGLWVQKYSLGPTRKAVLKVVATYPKKEKRILDMGCGTGQLMVELNKAFGEKYLKFTGVDYSAGMIEQAQKSTPFAELFVKDISQVKTLDGDFDIITCTHSIPYYSDQKKAILDMGTKLRPGGMLIIACASGNSVYDKMALGFVKLTTGFAKYPSVSALKAMGEGGLKAKKVIRIREKWFMPSIIVMVFEKEKCN